MVKPLHPTLIFNNEPIKMVLQHDHLGVTLTQNLLWRPQVLKIHQKASKKLNMLKPLKLKLQRKTLEILYKSLVRSCLEYADIVWDVCCEADRDLLESLQFEAARLVTEALKGTQRKNLLKETAWFSLKERRNNHKLTMIYKLINNLVPLYLSELCPKYVKSRTNYDLRANDHLIVPFSQTKCFMDSFLISSINLWNNLPESVHSSPSLDCFKNNVTRHFDTSTCNPLYYVDDRLPAIFHTRFRLSNSMLN